MTSAESVPEIHSSSTNGIVFRIIRFTGMLPLSTNHIHEPLSAAQTAQTTSSKNNVTHTIVGSENDHNNCCCILVPENSLTCGIDSMCNNESTL